MISRGLKSLSQVLLKSFKDKSILVSKMCTAAKAYETLSITTPKPFVYHVELNRPQKVNALNHIMWIELAKCFDELSENADCRSVVISGSGKLFCAGIDVSDFMKLAPQLAEIDDVSRKAKLLYKMIKMYQYSFTSMEVCNKPVISAVHSACIGAGVDLITATDIRYCSKDAFFQIKEVDMGMAADVGTLQRLPKVIGSESLVRELCYTGRKMNADEALTCGLVSRVFPDKDSLLSGAIELAEQIASKSPVAVQGTKKCLVYARDHTVEEALEQMASFNQLALQSEDFATAVMAAATKNKDVTFSKL